MGFLDFLKKKRNKSTKKENLSQPDFEHLTPEGELPFGWVYRNSGFTQKIQGEYSYFLNIWLDSRNKSPKEQYSALKSFVIFLEDTEKLCKSKGECFEFWFYNILVSPDYIEKRKKDLAALTTQLK